MSAFSRISPADAHAMMASGAIQIADIRDPAAFAKGRMNGALRLDNTNVAELVLHGEFEQPLIVCCYHGISSQPAAEYLAQQGFEQVYSLDGGFEAWSQQFPNDVEVDA
ncbi:thiosulfate sulfurtransferase GlpE [Neiella marina]|uniref:Thiosulfate sulfurtransferase GlpE n=1 Tax=Neiella holothuriorum TaxID=2870530 RepID=A0ABS7EFU0_9GAMM|nr:thiosulfate sulfurtransferase GlpE [Neiella holothuriorum]MBW8191226.1 thiosulfate sulfurtransferase GlpE [Neiella holothuriorum]